MPDEPIVNPRKPVDEQTAEYLEEQSKLKGQRNILIALLGLVLLYAIHLNKKNHHAVNQAMRLKPQIEKLERLNESKDQLFSIVAHDLRSAVYNLQINIAKIKGSVAGDLKDEAMSHAEDAELVIGSTQSLLNNLLYWSLSQTGRISYQPEKVPVQPVTEQVCYDFYPIAATKNLVFHVKVTPGLSCTMDVNSVKIVLRNLIDNAIKYTPENGIVILSAWQTADRCFISVQDTGIGMDQDVLNAIEANDSRRVQQDTYGRRGTGIGLWLVKSMIERNGGALNISSVKGIGTTVTLNLPVDA